MMAVAQVRNKQVTKHFTEKTVKEIWKDRMAERKSGKATDLCDFVCNHFQKKIGIMSAVVEVGAELPCSMISRAVIQKALCLYADDTASSVGPQMHCRDSYIRQHDTRRTMVAPHQSALDLPS